MQSCPLHSSFQISFVVHQIHNMASIKTLPERWLATWSANNSSEWVALYKPDGVYIDHAFQIRAKGSKALDRHHKIWRTANPDFVMTLVPDSRIWWSADTDEHTGNGVCSFRTINRGTNEKNHWDDAPAGKKFEFRGVIDMVIEGGLIKELTEWYSHKPFQDSKPQENFRLTADSLED